MNDIQFANSMMKYLGKNFCLGDLNGSKGWDCLSILRDFFSQHGVTLPESLRDWNWSNYAERWARGEGMDVFREFLLGIGEPVDINYLMPGDLIVLEKAGYVTVGIYEGSGKFQAVSNPHGVIKCPLGFFRSAIIGTRRLIKK